MYGFLGASYLRETSSVRGFPGNSRGNLERYMSLLRRIFLNWVEI